MEIANEGVTVRWTYPLNRWRLPRAVNTLPLLMYLLTQASRRNVRLTYIRFSPLTPLLVWIARRLIPHSAIITEHNGWVASEASMGGWPAWLCTIVAHLQQLDSRLADATRAVTYDVMKCLIEAGVSKDKVFVAENGTDLSRFYPIDRIQAKIDSGLDPSHLHIGFLGTITPWQGVDVLLRAAAMLVKRYPNLRIVVGGSGGNIKAQQALAQDLNLSDVVIFLGWVPSAKANMVINSFDIAVAPYHLPPDRPIGSPVKLRDYAAAGRPVVAADYPVITHASDESWCLLHRPGDHVQLAARLEELLADSDRREAMGAHARSHAERNFSWNAVIDTITSRIPNIKR